MENVAQLLREELRQRQTRNPNFSLRAFARWLQLSPAHLSQVMSGKRPVTLRMAEKIVSRLGLSPVERLHFLKSTLPGWVEDDAHLPTGPDRVLPEDRFRLIADWYHFAILSLCKLPGAQSDPRWIARRLGISQSQASEATARLERMGLLQLKPNFKQIGDPLRVTSEVPSEAIRKFHKQTLALATEKIDTVEAGRRDLNAITMSINASKLPLARKLIDECLSKVSAVLETGTATDVYTLSMQLFPLTQALGDSTP